MPAPEDDRFLSAQELKTAAAHGHLPVLAERLAREHSWLALASLFEQVNNVPITLPALTETVRRCLPVLRDAHDRRRDRASAPEDLRTVRLLAGECLIARVSGSALTEIERLALTVGGAALADGGDLHRAATTFEQARNWASAAEVWGRLGELDLMESCLAREEERYRTQRAAIGAVRDVEALAAAGERLAALRLAESVPEGAAESNAARQLAMDLRSRLVHARSVVLRLADDRAGSTFCFAATPAVLGRDPLVEIALRDPGVSRRHAVIALVEGEPSLTDAGSRAGTFVGGARLSAALPVRGPIEINLGPTCRLALEMPSPEHLILRGLSGLDRGLCAVVGSGTGQLPLRAVIADAGDTWLQFDPGGGGHLCRPPETQVRIAGQLVSPRVDLLHGDILDIGVGAGRVRLEVV